MSALLRSVTNSLFGLKLSPFLTQTRNSTIRMPKPRKRNPVWFVRQTRVKHDDAITQENQEFIKEVVHHRYGAPAIIRGTETYQNASQNSILKQGELPGGELWNPYVKRAGAIARKIGVVPLWKKDGSKVMTTMLQIRDNYVVKYTPPGEYEPAQKPRHTDTSRYGCLLVGAECADPSLLTREYCGLFKDSGVMPTRILGRFLISTSAALQPGTPINASHFRVGEYVDVRGKTVDRGFQGVMKRHGFKGMPASHGVTKTHRRGGNIGGGGEKARVWPGTRMPGHMGNRYRIIKGLKIWRMNTQYNVLWVSGSAIAGETNNVVYIYDTVLPLRKPKEALPYPTSYEDTQVNDIWSEELHCFKDPTILFNTE